MVDADTPMVFSDRMKRARPSSPPRDSTVRRVAHVVESMDDSYGGPARSIPELCKCQIDTGLLPIIYTASRTGAIVNATLDSGSLPVRVFHQYGSDKLRFCPGLLAALLADVRAGRIEAIHLHSPWNFVAFAAWMASRLGGVRLVFSPRGSLFAWSLSQGRWRKNLAWYAFMRRMLQHAYAIHVTDRSEEEAVRLLGVTTRIETVPNSINIDEVGEVPQRDRAREVLGLPAGGRYALFMSRIHPKKGLVELLSAWEEERMAESGWQLLIVGPESDPAYVAEVRGLAARPSMAGSVRLLPPVYGPGRLDYFAASDLFVLPSHSENFGNSIAEAMLAGLPVITTSGTPWSDIATQGLGWYISLGPAELRGALREASHAPLATLQSMGRRGQEYVLARFSRTAIREKVWRLYNDTPSPLSGVNVAR